MDFRIYIAKLPSKSRLYFSVFSGKNKKNPSIVRKPVNIQYLFANTSWMCIRSVSTYTRCASVFLYFLGILSLYPFLVISLFYFDIRTVGTTSNLQTIRFLFYDFFSDFLNKY